nr:chemotaxis response regulator protein-glutamate methylesterase [Kofleriaceae bacterium]
MSVVAPIKVLVVDDSVVIRKLLTTALSGASDVEVVGTAANGKIALAKIPELAPDVVTLDLEMPEMDGLETLKVLRVKWPRLPVIMFSTRTERGAAATIDALTNGASDYVTKPSNVGSMSLGIERIRDELLPKVRALAGRSAPPTISTVLPVAARPTTAIRRVAAPQPVTLRRPIEVIALGASTGGPAAVGTVLAALPASFPVPILIVQHMLPTFTSHFAQRLGSLSKLRVIEAAGGETIEPGTVYLARGDFHLCVERKRERGVLVLDKGMPENFCRPAVDVTFRSVAREYGAAALGVVLTGMGADGLAGAELLQAAGANMIVQDEATSTVWGMPGLIARAGRANEVLPLADIAPALLRLVGGARMPLAAGGRP